MNSFGLWIALLLIALLVGIALWVWPGYARASGSRDDGEWGNFEPVLRCRREYTGLEPGRLYWFRVATLGAAGIGPWSEPFSGRAG